MNFSVTAIVVSYNRAKLLQECLDAIAAQARKPDRVIVVDNASTDGAYDVAMRHPLKADVVRLKSNVGGAGGFCAGMALALHDGFPGEAGQHYLWVMDDDTVPTPTALERLLEAAQEAHAANQSWPTLLGSQARWVDGRIHAMNKPRRRSSLEGLNSRTAAGLTNSRGTFQVRSLSFVSCLINAQTMLKLRALPVSAYFLWNDDFEFTSRLLRDGIGYYVPASEVVHKTKTFGSSDADPGKRFYFEVRNKVWMLRFAKRDFHGPEYVELVLKTIRRFALTFLHSSDRRLTLSCLRRGLKEGLSRRPASNANVLSGNPEVAQAVNAVEGVRR